MNSKSMVTPVAWLYVLLSVVAGGCQIPPVDYDLEMAQSLVRDGTRLADLGLHQRALERFDRAVGVKPSYSVAWFKKGATLRDLDQPSEALECFRKATTLSPRYATAWLHTGYVLEDLGRNEEAAVAFEKASELGSSEARRERQIDELLRAVVQGNLEAVESLIEADSALVHARPTGGLTPLHYAASSGNREVVEVLLVHEADVDAEDERGTTPIQAARLRGNQQIVELLAKH